MGVKFDRWTFLKLIEVALVVVCLVFKRVTDDEASRLFLYLQKLSREWSLLNNVTWSRVGAAVADATYGGYLIITAALFFGKLFGELPTQKRITEFILLGVGAALFIALDSVPPDLVDNAAIIWGGPKAKVPLPIQSAQRRTSRSKPTEPKSFIQQVHDIEKQIEDSEKKQLDSFDPKKSKQHKHNGLQNGRGRQNGQVSEMENTKNVKGYQQMRDEFPRNYSIYGKDVVDGNETDDTEIRLPPKMDKIEPHSPVWGHIRKGQYGKYAIVTPPIVFPKPKERQEERPPSGPGEPGYVQYTAQHWGETATKTPRHSPTEV
ncbi:hypothetical protein NQ317_009189 [Molorchus minor]|uniref:Uncharacterized protein n=1 Tax=Molorchus minor TaxID=1323400 RepID=A0ABQ9JPY6_9CUCU|nr:hypothetical protein NQ317_009189 [Molorchus minor]